MDLDAVLRVADMARYYNAKTIDIVAFLEAAASERRVSARSGISSRSGSLRLVAMREPWDMVRLKAEGVPGSSKEFEDSLTYSKGRLLASEYPFCLPIRL
jgi:hypothetical protein